MINFLTNYKFSRFLFNGGIATSAHWLLMYVLIVNNLDPLVSSFFGALVGALVNYILQFYFTFNCRQTHRQTIPLYVLVLCFSLTLNTIILMLLIDVFEIKVIIAQFITTLSVMFTNYILFNFKVFTLQYHKINEN